MAEGEFVFAARLEDVPEGGLHPVKIGDTKIVLAESEGEIFALYDECSHEEFPLSDGEIVDGQVECILHGARFDLRSGRPKALPAVRPVRTYECRVEDGEIRVRV